MKKVLVSIIIPVSPDENCKRTVNAIKKSNVLKKFAELIIVKGNSPSIQRNEAAKIAKGRILYFLDNDSIPEATNFEKIIKFFKLHKEAVVIGGPSVSPQFEKGFSYAAGVALGSFFGSAFSSARYSPKGKLRQSTELELILCNMAFKKSVFIKAGMFNPNLYPNEENELLNRIKRMGYQIWYDPNIRVYRKHRENMLKFIKQIFNYGRGRAEQVLIDKSNITPFPLISLLFDIYIILILFLNRLPLWIYFLLLTSVSIYQMVKEKKIIPHLFLSYFIIHTVYGIGFFWGLIKKCLRFKHKQAKIWYKIINN